MCLSSLMVFGMVIVGIALVLVSLSFSRASEKKFQETLTIVLNDPEFQWKEKERTIRYQGLNFCYEKYSGSRNSPPSFSVSVECRGTGGEFGISGEGGFERFFKNVGLTREIQTQEEAFNSRFYIASDTPQFVHDYFVSAEKREAVTRLFDQKASTVTHDNHRLTVIWKGNSSHADGVAGMRSAIEALAVLAKDIPLCHDVVSPAGPDGGGYSFKRVLMSSLATASAVAGFVSVIWASASYPVFDVWKLFLFALKFSLPALAVFLYFAVTTLAGNSRSHRDILLAGFLALAGFLMLGCGISGLYNGMQDASAPAGHTTLIVDKRIHRSKNSRTYKLTVQSWRPGNAYEYLSTSRSVYQNVVPGKQKAVVYTRPGKLGFEWFVSYRLLP
jgi:hypothetical protein